MNRDRRGRRVADAALWRRSASEGEPRRGDGLWGILGTAISFGLIGLLLYYADKAPTPSAKP